MIIEVKTNTISVFLLSNFMFNSMRYLWILLAILFI